MILELIAGIVVTLTALALVLEPLLRPGGRVPLPADDDVEPEDPEESESPKIRALLTLREIEFDRATGKLSDDDYATLKARYAGEALAAMNEEARASASADPAAHVDDRAEAMVQRFKQRRGEAMRCVVCGPRPEPGAVFCSRCGRSLLQADASARCFHCGHELPDGAKFCSTC
ncbi:MAG TPA: zinc ribbon domain-containing protein, partial [Gemmatimonadales bacterium]